MSFQRYDGETGPIANDEGRQGRRPPAFADPHRKLLLSAVLGGVAVMGLLIGAAKASFPAWHDYVALSCIAACVVVAGRQVHRILILARTAPLPILRPRSAERRALVMSAMEAFLAGLACAGCVWWGRMIWSWAKEPATVSGEHSGLWWWTVLAIAAAAALGGAIFATCCALACRRWTRAMRAALGKGDVGWS